MSLIWQNACIVRKCVVESEGSTLLYGLYCNRLVCELLGSNEMTECSPVRDSRTPNLVDFRVIWQVLFDCGRLEWPETVKRQSDQEIKILENFDIV